MADLKEKLCDDACSFDFFQAVALLEKLLRSQGISDPVNSGYIRIFSDSSLSFPPNDISSIQIKDEVFHIIVTFMGLSGVSSPLPLYFSDWICRHKEDSTPLRDFVSIFNNRIYSLFYMAWKRSNPLFTDENTQSVYKKIVSLASMGTSCLKDNPLSFCRLLTSGRGTAEGLSALISLVFNGIPVNVQEFVPEWVEVYGLKALGGCRLGEDSLLGSRIYDFTGKFRIVIGPLEPEIFKSFLPGSPSIEKIRKLTDSFMTAPLDYDIEIRIRNQDMEQVILGSKSAPLGHSSILGKPTGDLKSIVHRGR